MDELELKTIAAAADEVLLRSGPSVERAAVAWLHVLSENPSNLGPYLEFRQPPTVSKAIRRDGLEAARIARNLVRSAVSRPLGPDEAEALRPADVLIVSHLVNERHLESEQDFYFGDLQRLLEERGFSSLLVLRNHLRGNESGLRRRARRAGPRARLLLPRLMAPAQEARLAGRMFRERRKLEKEAEASADELARSVALEAARRATSEPAVTTLRLHGQIETVCRFVRPRAVFVTYEGHGWERCAWEAASRVDPDVLKVGYQHTILLKNAHAVRRLLGAKPFDPDVVLTVGDVTREVLERSLEGVRVTTFGTHRSAPGPAPARRGGRPAGCLVLPEGIESECVILFEFAAECARLLPEMLFTFRLHPLMSFESLSARHAVFRSLPSNVELSAGSLDEDLARSSYCLYRGSSTAIYAGRAGVKPIYVARGGEIPFDPLHMLGTANRLVWSPADFLQVISTPPAVEEREVEAARQLCDRYVLPVQPEGLEPVFDFLRRGSRAGAMPETG